jgi:type IV pilus assembly protein PilZ
MTKSTPKSPKQPKSAKPSKSSSSAQGTRDDRQDHRIPIQMLVDYKSGGNYLFDFCKDLGTGGVFIETSRPLAMGAELELTFTIPDSKETLRTKGTVIWSQPPVAERPDINPGMGVQFTNFSAGNRKMLDHFMERYGAQKNGGAEKRIAS